MKIIIQYKTNNMKKLLVLSMVLLSFVSYGQTYSIIRKSTTFESNGTKKQIVGESIKESISPFYGLKKVYPKKYIATLNITDTLATFEDSEMKLELFIKYKITKNGFQFIMCKDVDGNDYNYSVSPGSIILMYQGNDKLSDNVIIKEIIYSIN